MLSRAPREVKHLSPQLVESEGLGNEVLAFGQLVHRVGIRRRATEEKTASQVGPKNGGLTPKLQPVHAGHVQVGDDHVEVATADASERLRSVRGRRHLTAKSPKIPGNGGPECRVVFDKQDAEFRVGRGFHGAGRKLHKTARTVKT